LFVISGVEIKSRKGTTQGDPLGMIIFAIGTTPLLEIIHTTTPDNSNRYVAFANDITAVH